MRRNPEPYIPNQGGRVKDLRENIEEIENKLQLQFTDERLKELLYIFYFTLIRIKNEKTVETMDQYRLVTTTQRVFCGGRLCR